MTSVANSVRANSAPVNFERIRKSSVDQIFSLAPNIIEYKIFRNIKSNGLVHSFYICLSTDHNFHN